MTRVDKLICAFLVALFAFSAADKLLHVGGFINAIDDYKILPIPLGALLAPLLIAAEFAVAVGLALRRWRRVAALQAAGLMALFTIAILSQRLLGRRGICGCWFSITALPDNAHLVFNVLVLGLSLAVWHAAQAGVQHGRP